MGYETFEKLCKKRGVKPADVSRATGIATATLTSWKKGAYSPKQDKLQKMADFFGVSVDYLITGVYPDTTSPFAVYQQDSDFMSYIHRLWLLPESYRQDVYKQIKYAEMGYKEEIEETREKGAALQA